ncbi:MAG: hypothetical protein Q8N89_12640 [Azonexus sp.]|nr:hypothetical protein [Azonexus sp.]
MRSGTVAEFRIKALAEGFDEVLERSWPADAVLDSHTHPFAVKARVVRGEMWRPLAPALGTSRLATALSWAAR